MAYIIKHITTEQELDRALLLESRIFAGQPYLGQGKYSKEAWLNRIKDYGDLMIYTESDNEIIGIVFGRVEDNGNVIVGPVATDERFRRQGTAQEMMQLLEKRAVDHGIHNFTLGSVEESEGFYAKLGYTGTLLIQSEKHSIEELLLLNTKYKVNYTRVHDGTINQVNLALPAADRELQRKYETDLPGCHTQMMFWKNI